MLLHLYLHLPIHTYRLIFNKCQVWIRAPPEATISEKGGAVNPVRCLLSNGVEVGGEK